MSDTLKSYGGTFVHGIEPTDPFPAWNLALRGRLVSPDFAARTDAGLGQTRKSLRDDPIEDLRKTPRPLSSAGRQSTLAGQFRTLPGYDLSTPGADESQMMRSIHQTVSARPRTAL